MPTLAEKYQVVAIDQRGYNLSGQPKGVANYAMPKLVGDVAAVVKHFQQQKATIVGHDWGGMVAWQFAMNYPELTERLVILNLPHPNGLQRELANNPQQQKNSEYARFLSVRRGGVAGESRIACGLGEGPGSKRGVPSSDASILGRWNVELLQSQLSARTLRSSDQRWPEGQVFRLDDSWPEGQVPFGGWIERQLEMDREGSDISYGSRCGPFRSTRCGRFRDKKRFPVGWIVSSPVENFKDSRFRSPFRIQRWPYARGI
jgi:pimeloyl-ACP methyl ester carboxylesterase